MRAAEVGAAILVGSICGRWLGMLAWQLTVWIRRSRHREVLVARSCWCPVGWPHRGDCAAGRVPSPSPLDMVRVAPRPAPPWPWPPTDSRRYLRPDWRHFVPSAPPSLGSDRRHDLN